jgi:hypothetical protein
MRTQMAAAIAAIVLVCGCGAEESDPGSASDGGAGPGLPGSIDCVSDELGLTNAVSVAVDGDSVFIAELDATGEVGAVVRADKGCTEATRILETGFPSGDASLTITWTAECEADSLISFVILGPTSLNTTVDCNEAAVTFDGLAPGGYIFTAEHADGGVGFDGNEVEVSGDETVGPIDLMPID